MKLRYWITTGIAAVGIVLSLALFLLHEPQAKAGENGLFKNDLCGTIELVDGTMVLNGQRSVRYTVDKDASGPYIVPRTYVGAVPDLGFDVDGTRSVLKLRLDRLPVPTKILLHEGLTPYVFTRQTPRPRR